MANVFFQGTIGINGFSMVLPTLNHHHLMFFDQPTIDFNGFSMVFRFFRTMVWKLQSNKKCVNSTRDKMCSNNNLSSNFSFLQRTLTISMILKRQLTNLMILKRPLKISMVMKRPLKIFNGFGGHHYHSQFPRRGGKSKIN